MKGIRVLFTTALDEERRRYLRELGISYDEIPLLRFASVEFSPKDIPNAQAWAFSSKRAVSVVHSKIDQLPKPELIFCVGEGTSKELKGVAPILMPSQANGRAMSELIATHKPESVVYFRGSKVAFDLADSLASTKIEVFSVLAYRTKAISKRIKMDIYSHVVFMSPSAVEAFTKKNCMLSGQKAVVIGSTTRRKAEDLGFKNLVQSDQAHFFSITQEIVTSHPF